MDEKRAVWPRLLPAELQGGPNSRSRKIALMRKELAVEPISDMCVGGKVRYPKACGGPVKRGMAGGGIAMSIMDETVEPEGAETTENAMSETEAGPVGRFTGTSENGIVKPLEESDVDVHQGEFVISAPIVNALGGPEATEDAIIGLVKDRISNAEETLPYDEKGRKRTAPMPISEEVEGTPEQEERKFQEATGPGKAASGLQSYLFLPRNTTIAPISAPASIPGAIPINMKPNLNLQSQGPGGNISGTFQSPITSAIQSVQSAITPPVTPAPAAAFIPAFTPPPQQTLEYAPPSYTPPELTVPEVPETLPALPPTAPIPIDYQPTSFSFTPDAEQIDATIEQLETPEERAAAHAAITAGKSLEEAIEAGRAARVQTTGTVIPVDDATAFTAAETARRAEVDEGIRRQAMARLAAQAAGNDPYLQRQIEETLQKNAGNVTAARAALQAQLANQGVTEATAAGIMNQFDAAAQLNAAQLQSELTGKEMAAQQKAQTDLLAAATGASQFAQTMGQRQTEFEQTHALSVRNYEDAQTWKQLAFMLDSNTPIDQIQSFVSTNLGLDVDLSNLRTAQQAQDFGAASSALATYINQQVTGGLGGNYDNLTDTNRLTTILSDPKIKAELDRMWLATGQTQDSIGSSDYNTFARNTLTSMRNVNDPAMAIVNAMSDETLINSFIGPDFVEDYEYNGITGAAGVRAALQHIVIRGGLSRNADGDLVTDASNPAWSILNEADPSRVGEVIGLDPDDLWTEGTYNGKTYIVTPDGIRLKTETDGDQFRNGDKPLTEGTTVTVGGRTYKSNGDFTFEVVDTVEALADYEGAANPWGPAATTYLTEVGGGSWTSEAGQRIIADRVSWLSKNMTNNDSWKKLIGVSKSDPVYKAILSGARDLSSIDVDEVDDWGANTIRFDPTTTKAGYYKSGSQLYYLPSQETVNYDWEDEDGDMLKIYNVTTGAWKYVDAKEIWKGTRILSPQDETKGFSVTNSDYAQTIDHYTFTTRGA